MTQNASDVEIANQGFAAFRQDLNDVLEDITTLHSGTAAPSTTYANQWWYETDTDKLYIRNEDNDAWIELLTLDQVNDKLASLNMQGGELILDADGDTSITADTDDRIDFKTGGTDAMHIDASQNLLVGKASDSFGTAGCEARPEGALRITRNGSTAGFFNRLTSDGTIVEFYKDSSSVGTMGTSGGDLTIDASAGAGVLKASGSNEFAWASNLFYPITDNAKDLGTSSFRFNDLYLGGGVYLGGTGSANKLTDYEEGLWSPHIRDSHDGSIKVTCNDNGKYVKIGTHAFVTTKIFQNSINASFTGYPYIALPFTGSGNGELRQFVPAYVLSFGTIKTAVTLGGTTTMRFATDRDNPYSNLAGTGLTLSGSLRFYGGISYITA